MDYGSMTGKRRGADNEDRVNKYLGRKTGGEVSDEEQDRKMVRSAVHKHEAAMHPGKKETKLAEGGRPSSRADKPGRFAKGGPVKTPKTNISININATPSEKKDGGEDDAGKKAALMAALASAAPPPAPPMAGLGGPSGPLPGMKRGGMVAGAATGEGRLEKADDQRRLRKVMG